MRHVLHEQAKLIFHEDAAHLRETIRSLNELALTTETLISGGFKSRDDLEKVRRKAEKLEKHVDDLSEELWRPLLVSVSPVFKRLEESVNRRDGAAGLRDHTKAHFHDMRIRLLEQTVGARELTNISDLGDENERIWLQFFEKQLGPMFKVLRGGVIMDYQGNRSGQIDLIITAADEHIVFPSDSEGGKAMVYVDQVISAIMVTSTLDCGKLRKDWLSLQQIPSYAEKEQELSYPHLQKEPWPLCYIVASQSDEPDELKGEWEKICDEGHTRLIPQLVVALDSGFFYGGMDSLVWPHPNRDRLNREAGHVGMQLGIHAGLGLGWLLLQHQTRLASVQKRGLHPIGRQARQLIDATLNYAGVATSSRFNHSFYMCPIIGILEWGAFGSHVHNRLFCVTMCIRVSETKRKDMEVSNSTAQRPTGLNQSQWASENLRWFNRSSNATIVLGKWLFAEEWLNRKSKTSHSMRIVAFNTETGDEIISESIGKLTQIPKSEAELTSLSLSSFYFGPQ